MTRYISRLIIILSVLLAISCQSSDDLVTHYNKSLNYLNYKSYSLLEWDTNNDSIISPEIKDRILYAIANELNLRGYHYNKDGGDMRIAVHVLIDKKSAEIAYNDYYKNQYNNSYATNSMGFGNKSERFDKYEYLEGTLLVDIFEHESRQLIWQGAKVNTLKETKSTEERNMRIERIVEETFESFPVEKISN